MAKSRSMTMFGRLAFLCVWLATCGASLSVDVQAQTPLTWDTLQQRLQHEADQGWSGAILIAKNGEIVVGRGYGWADPDKKIPNKSDTVFAIGSVPREFTRAAIYQLMDQGKVSGLDVIGRFIKDVPEDKRTITIEQLMNGRSGLADVLDDPKDGKKSRVPLNGQDAVRLILDSELRFKPGTGRNPSDAAFVLLAAIVELVSGEAYPDYVRERLFKPAGMTDTGFFGDPVEADRLAIGSGFRSSGEINAPPYWGATSWQIMGSGGQVSTVQDLYRWLAALNSGTIVSPAFVPQLMGQPGSLHHSGDLFGFEILYTPDPQNGFILVSNNVNSPERRQALSQLARDLMILTVPPTPSEYTLGIAISINPTGDLVVEQAIPGGAAQVGGLKPGDALISAGNVPLGDHPGSVLQPYLVSGEPIEFHIQRDGQSMTVTVTPQRKKQ